MSYQEPNSKILQHYGDQMPNANQSIRSNPTEQQIRSLEEEIEMTIFNYESLLQMEKKNAIDRSQFLLYLIQSTRQRQTQEIESLKMQLETAVEEKEEAQTLEKQMESIGQGVDSIVEEGKRLKQQNQLLQHELEEQEHREHEIDEEISICQRELDQYRQKIDEWERTKIKWNRRKKDLLEIINQTERRVNGARLQGVVEGDHEHYGNEDIYNEAYLRNYHHKQDQMNIEDDMNMLLHKYSNVRPQK